MLSDDRHAMRIAIVMTLLLLLVYPDKTWFVRIPVTILAIIAILVERVRRAPLLWFACGLLLLAGVATRWSSADNHRYLMAYWLLAICVAMMASDAEPALKRSARLLLGFCFLFATVWKAMSPDFMNGTFFHFTLLADARFSIVVEWLGGVTANMRQLNSLGMAAIRHYASPIESLQLADASHTRALALAMTWWTVAVEGALALLFLLPSRLRVTHVRDFVLLIFALTTYAIAPVLAFGWTLLILGMVQVSERARFVRPAYIVVFVVLQLYGAPWKELVQSATGA